ncbi:MAG TPA: MFS transporter [Candidatus Binatia bacterium]|nr:MFS transporter [Candidatus Binatia bacterium]
MNRTPLGAGLRAFRHRNYRLFYAGQAISLVGTWMQSVAQAWLVLTLTNDPFWLGVVSAAQFAPVVLFGLFGGLVADALPKRRALVVVQAAMMVLALLLWLLTATGAVTVTAVLVLALGLGVANAVDMPVRQSFVVEMVGRDDVANAVALNSAMFNGARVLGPAVAGLVIGAAGIAPAFLINGLSFLAVIGGLLRMRDEELVPVRLAERPRTMAQVRSALAEGLRYVRRTPPVLLATVVVGFVSTVAMNFQVIVPAFARSVLGVGAEGFGFLMAASGVGSVLAALGLAFGRPRPSVLLGGAVVLGAAQVALAGTTSYPVAALLLFLAGAGGIAMAATANTTIQLAVPDGLRGRVMSVYTTVFAGSAPVGGLFVGSLASAAGIQAAVLVGGLLGVAVAVAAWAWWRLRWSGLELAAPGSGEGAVPVSLRRVR